MNSSRARAIVRLMRIGSVARSGFLAAMLLAAYAQSFAARVIFVAGPGGASAAQQQLQAAATFYGLDTEIQSSQGNRIHLQTIRDKETVAVVLSADALPGIDRQRLLAALGHGTSSLPLLITGIDDRTDAALLREWSSGAVTGSQRVADSKGGSYAVSQGSAITAQLGGARLPWNGGDLRVLTLDHVSGAQSLIAFQSGGTNAPVFVEVEAQGSRIWFAAASDAPPVAVSADPYRQQAVFARLAPSMLFLRHAAGERAWHSPGSYANFTIDDLWLREPYGHVNYEALLQQSQVHNFHTTIAFVPWNYDRSEPKMVSLFLQHPERLSVSVHGNNHVHQEFGPLATHPLDKQTVDMQQGLARMERFSALTGIPYDRVMVFPHSIAPEATFEKLKERNYLATANSLNVPSDAAAPAGEDFALRTATLSFGGFPSLRRYSAETDIPEAQLAIDAFLGNPMLFYAHESFFATGIDAFNQTADTVNRLEPKTEWRGLGYIARHLYLERLREDGGYDVRAYSASLQITNAHARDAVYFIERPESGSSAEAMLVNGTTVPFTRSGGMVHLQVTVPAGQTREIVTTYGDESLLSTTDIARPSWRVNAIRLLSDFRDNAVSNTGLGRWFIHSYAENGRPWDLGMAAGAVLLALLIGFLLTRRRPRTPRLPVKAAVASRAG